MIGHSDDEIGDSPDEWTSRLHPEDLSPVFAEIERYKKGEVPVFQSEYRLRCKDGSYKWFLDRGKVIERTDDGEALRVIGTQTDISEYKQLQAKHEKLIGELQEALARVKQLGGLLPICSYCKKIRDDKGYWKQIESYIAEHSEAEFSHSICKECVKKYFPEIYEEDDE
jgi:PAS domain S-box-containing protein